MGEGAFFFTHQPPNLFCLFFKEAHKITGHTHHAYICIKGGAPPIFFLIALTLRGGGCPLNYIYGEIFSMGDNPPVYK